MRNQSADCDMTFFDQVLNAIAGKIWQILNQEFVQANRLCICEHKSDARPRRELIHPGFPLQQWNSGCCVHQCFYPLEFC